MSDIACPKCGIQFAAPPSQHIPTGSHAIYTCPSCRHKAPANRFFAAIAKVHRAAAKRNKQDEAEAAKRIADERKGFVADRERTEKATKKAINKRAAREYHERQAQEKSDEAARYRTGKTLSDYDIDRIRLDSLRLQAAYMLIVI